MKVYGVRELLLPIRNQLSDVIHACVVEALQFLVDKRTHRFFDLDNDDFFSTGDEIKLSYRVNV